MKASDLFLRCLEAEGVKTIFGVPGEENADLMISLLDSPIEFIICRHEQAAAFMADMYGRVTGKPGVCLSTLGPGTTNLLTGVASANMDHSPLVAIVGQTSTRRMHKESHQMMDSISMFKPVTKWATTVRDSDNIPEVVRKAFKLATVEKPGATVIELPEDIARGNSDEKPMIPTFSNPEGGVKPYLVKRALDIIRAADTPLILLGNGCSRDCASEQITRLIDQTGIYAVSTFMGKGVLSDRHKQSLFAVGLGLNDIVTEAFEQADLVICIGYDMVEWPPARWNIGKPKRIIHIDTQAAEVDNKYPVTLDIVGSILETVNAFNEQLTCPIPTKTPQFEALRTRISIDLSEFDNDTSFPVKPQRIISDMRAVLRDDDILISDVGVHKLWVARDYKTYLPRTTIITNGFCSMGISLPGAIAAKKEFPAKNVVALCGDGGFLMNVQDLITAVRYKIPITVVIWNDNCYGMIKWKQTLTYCKSSNVDLVNPDFVMLAKSFGCRGIQISSADQFRPALQEAFSHTDCPTVIAVPIDYDQNIELAKKMGGYHCPLDPAKK
ncbi:MAG: acetolactate synthase large subunit [Candidatus Riflebacteria bacterium]|nr:acetolactate synthase large subunit [Candidatus Riflebacteria bacterium]